MPYKDPEKEKARRQTPEYKAKQKEANRKYREKHKAQEKARQQTPEFIAQQKIYRQSPEYKKSSRISDWKRYGVICDDFDTLYERYLNTEFCELCNVELTVDRYNTSTTRCLDHCHETGEFS